MPAGDADTTVRPVGTLGAVVSPLATTVRAPACVVEYPLAIPSRSANVQSRPSVTV